MVSLSGGHSYAGAPLRQVHLSSGRPRLAAPGRRPARARQAGVRRRLRRLRRGPPPARLLARRDAGRRRPDAALPGPEPRAHPRVPRRARPERPHEVVLDPPLLPRHDQGVRVLGRVSPRGAPGTCQVPVRLPVREDPRVVRAGGGRALPDHAGAHPHWTRVSFRGPQHVVFVRPRRPGVRRGLRDRRARRLPRPRAEAARDRVEPLHQARHSHVHVRLLLGRAGAGRAGRRGDPRSRRPWRERSDFDEIRDVTVIGAGPVGLSAAFWAGMREASSRIIDSLPELGGQLDDAVPGEVDLRRARPSPRAGQGPGREDARADARAVRRAGAPGHDGRADLLGGRRASSCTPRAATCARAR